MFDNLFNSANPEDVLYDFLDQHYHYAESRGILTNYYITQISGKKFSIESFEINSETDRKNTKSDYTLEFTDLPDGDGEVTIQIKGNVNDNRVNKSFTAGESFQPLIDYIEEQGEFQI